MKSNQDKELKSVISLAHEGVLQPVVTRTSLGQAAAVLDALHEGQVAGRLVVTDFSDVRDSG